MPGAASREFDVIKDIAVRAIERVAMPTSFAIWLSVAIMMISSGGDVAAKSTAQHIGMTLAA